MNALAPIKFSDPGYNGGAVSNGFLTSDGFIVEPGNTNGYAVDYGGWLLDRYQKGRLVLDKNTAGLVRGTCAAFNITPQSFWEGVGKPVVAIALSVIGAEALGSAEGGVAAGSTGAGSGALAPTVVTTGETGATALPTIDTTLISIPGQIAPLTAGGGLSVGGGLAAGGGGLAAGGGGGGGGGGLWSSFESLLSSVGGSAAKTLGGTLALGALAGGKKGTAPGNVLGGPGGSVGGPKPAASGSVLLLAALGAAAFFLMG